MDWFLRRENVVDGPLVEEELHRRLRAGTINAETFVAPNRVDFHPLAAWTTFSPSGSLRAEQFQREEDARPDASALQLGKDRRTAIIGTKGPYTVEAEPVRSGKGTVVLGTRGDESNEPSAPQWPGAAQSDPDQDGASAGVPEKEPPEPGSFFESVPVEAPTPRQEQDDAEAFPAPRAARDEQSPLVAGAPGPREPRPARAPVPIPALPPVQDRFEWVPVTIAIAVTLIVTFAGLALADRLLNGPATSEISRYLPAGGSAYIEVPSVQRWGRGLARLSFASDEGLVLESWLDSVQTSGVTETERLLERVDSFALARVGEETVYATEYDDDPSVDAFVAAQDKIADSQWGPRYLRSGRTECLWITGERVEICGTGDALETAIEVLAGRAPSAQDDPYLSAVKERSLSSYLPFVTHPGLYSVATPRLTAELPLLANLSLATVKAGVDKRGYFESLDLVWPAGKAPAGSSASLPTFWQDLPEGTVFYVNYRALPPRTPEQFAAQLENLPSLGPGGPTAEQLVQRVHEELGFEPSALFEGLGDEGLVALSVAPSTSLQQEKGAPFGGALWLLQSIDDPGRVRRTVTSLIERFSEERTGLKWQDEDNLVAEGPDGLSVHLRFEKGRLRVGLGQKTEIARVLSGETRLKNDPAHEAAFDDLDPDATLVAWLDWGRLLREPQIAKQKTVPANIAQALTTEGPDRPVAALSMRRFESGDFRIRSRNFPTGLLLFALSAAGQMQQLTSPFDDDTAPSGSGLLPSPDRRDGASQAPKPEWIGPGHDGSFHLPSP